MSKAIQPIELHKNNVINRASIITHTGRIIRGLSKDKSWIIKIIEGAETRRDVQNRTYQMLKGQVAKQLYFDPDYVDGVSKHDILLPMKLSDFNQETGEAGPEFERGLFEKEVIEAVKDKFEHEKYMHIISAQVRSKNLEIPFFARYMDTFMDYWAERGVHLVINPKDHKRAIGVAA